METQAATDQEQRLVPVGHVLAQRDSASEGELPSTMTCPHGVWIAACAVCKPIQTSRDQAWHFRHPTLGYIDSKGEFDRKAKAQGLVRVSTDELMTRGEPTKPGPVRVDARQIGALVKEFTEKAKNPDLVAAHEARQAQRMAQPVSPVGVDYAKSA